MDNYEFDEFGVLHQISYSPIVYDRSYSLKAYAHIQHKCKLMSHMRWEYICKHLSFKPVQILDVGFGLGNFLDVCAQNGAITYGHDLTRDHLPPHTKWVSDPTQGEYDLITFFDSLEHMPSLEFLKQIRTKAICISVPWCHQPHESTWLQSWKHFKPNEHLHYFHAQSLIALMDALGYTCLNHGNPEDQIRETPSHEQNILTAIFEKRDAL